MLIVQAESGTLMALRTVLIPLLLISFLCTAGCMQPGVADSQTPAPSTPPSIAKYQLTIAQPEDTSTLIQMDTDVYNLGEVVEFVIFNNKTRELSCTTNPPGFSVRYQKGTGQWVTRMGEETPSPGNTTILKPGESTMPYRFVTAGWAAGRYRIVTDCGVTREFLLRAIPAVTPPAPVCPPAGNTSPSIQVTSLRDQYAGEPFTIAGTTNLPAGQDLSYTLSARIPGTGTAAGTRLVSSQTPVYEGMCGINTWSVEGVIEIPGEYRIDISDRANTVSTFGRFFVLQEFQSAGTPAITVQETVPAISTG